jgi:hypothetical protein
MKNSTSPPATRMPHDNIPHWPSNASSVLALQEHTHTWRPGSPIYLENRLSPTSASRSNPEDSPESRPLVENLRVSVPPHPVLEGCPAESVNSEPVASSITYGPGVPRFRWTDDPYQLDPDVTIYYMNKYFSQIDSATSCVLPKNAFLHWVKDCRTKSPQDIMLMYAILAMGTVFELRAEAEACESPLSKLPTWLF